MKYSIIGSGNIGSAIAGHFARTGANVGVSASRGLTSVLPLVEKWGTAIEPVEIADALQAQVVVLAVPFEAVESLVSQVIDWEQRIIVDATNAIDYVDFTPAELGGCASSEVVAG